MRITGSSKFTKFATGEMVFCFQLTASGAGVVGSEVSGVPATAGVTRVSNAIGRATEPRTWSDEMMLVFLVMLEPC